jgi:hypothetical protein
MDVVTAYLYGSLDLNIYMKVPDGISVTNVLVGAHKTSISCANMSSKCIK